MTPFPDRLTRLKAATWAFQQELMAIGGLHFTALVLDPELQTTEKTHFIFLSSCGKEIGEKMFETYMRMSKDPRASMSFYDAIGKTSEVPQ